MNIVLSGQRHFGKDVLKLCEEIPGINILAVVSPADDYCLTRYAAAAGYKLIPAGTLNSFTMPENCDLGICAHSFDYIGKATRYKTKFGWLGYHPSLLPRHRGRSSIEWALRMKDIVTGGSLYWLNSGIDRGDIAYQDWIWLDHNLSAKEVWRDELAPLGLRLFETALKDLMAGKISRVPQGPVEKFSTFEPRLDLINDIYKPDLLMIGTPDKINKSEH